MFKKQLKDIKKYFKELPHDMIKQHEGYFREDKPCCFGAHLAHILLDRKHFSYGESEFKHRLGIENDAELYLLFAEAGLDMGISPFGSKRWNLPVLEVIKNLEKIKEIPDTAGADLRGADLRYAKLNNICLKDANLKSVRLSYANLRDADLSVADLQNADLSDAVLRGANLKGAYLTNTDLRGADLRGANLRDADLRGASLVGADFTGADLHKALILKKHEYLLYERIKKQLVLV